MAKRDDTVGRMAEGKHLVACSESDIGWIAGSSIGRGGKIQMKFDGDTVWVVTPEGCLLVWENEESNVVYNLEEVGPESFQEKRPKGV
jgi:hypothetical protein